MKAWLHAQTVEDGIYREVSEPVRPLRKGFLQIIEGQRRFLRVRIIGCQAGGGHAPILQEPPVARARLAELLKLLPSLPPIFFPACREHITTLRDGDACLPKEPLGSKTRILT